MIILLFFANFSDAYLRVKNCIIHNVPAVVMLEDKLSSGTRLLKPHTTKAPEQMRAPRPKGAHQPRPRTAKATSSAPQQMLWWPKHCWQGLQVAASELKGRNNLFEPNTPKFENEIEPSATLTAMSMTMFQKRQNCTAQKKNTLWHSQCLNPQWKTGHANDQGSVSTSD